MKAVKCLYIVVCTVVLSCSTVNAQIIFQQSVDNLPTGVYTLDQVSSDFQVTTHSATGFIRKGEGENRVTVDASQYALSNGKSLKVKYPKGGFDSEPSGAQWKTDLGGKYKELYLSYYVKFKTGFSFNKIGKLPGLAGGLSYDDRDGATEWSGKLMWRADGKAEFYLHQPITNEKQFPWVLNGKHAAFTTNKWHHIEIHYKVNSAGKNDGLMEAWLDNDLVARYSDFGLFTNNNDVGITIFFFSTFFGGNSVDAPDHDDYAWFDNVVVSTERIGDTSGGTPIDKAPAVVITSPTNNASYTAGTNITIQATATDDDGTVKRVEFYNNGTKIGTDYSQPFSYVISSASAGTYSLTAKAIDSDNLSTTSNPIKVTVKAEDNGGGTTCSFGTPSATSLPTFNEVTFTKLHVLGSGGPNLSTISKLRMNWDASTKSLKRFAFYTSDGNPSYYVDLRSKLTQNFGSTNPSITITGSPFGGLDGSYWVNKDGDNFVMVSKTGGFTLYFSNSASKPACSNVLLKKANFESLQNGKEFSIYPNPLNRDNLNLIDIPISAKTISIVDISGRELLQIPVNGAKMSIDVSEIKAGNYILLLKGDGEKIARSLYKK